MHPTSLSIVHIEDDPRWRELVVAIVEDLAGLEKFAAAAMAAQGLDLVQAIQPDLLLLDLRLPDADGFCVLQKLTALPRPPRVVVLSSRIDDLALYRVSRSGASGLLWKTPDLVRSLPVAIATVTAGGVYYPPEVQAALRRLKSDPQAFFKILSDRELELLEFLGAGREDEEIASRLAISPHTVRVHRQNIKQKLGLHNRMELVHWAIRTGVAEVQRVQ